MYYRFKSENELLDWADYQYNSECLFTDLITEKEYTEHKNKLIISNYEIALNPNYEQEEKEKEEQAEQARKAKLKMTKRDFFLYILQPYGVTYSTLMQALQSDDTLFACYEGCNHIYRYDTMFIGNIKGMLESITGQEINEQELIAFLDAQFELHNAKD